MSPLARKVGTLHKSQPNKFGAGKPCSNRRVTPDYAILDRFEDNDQAALEFSAGVTLNVPRSWLPPQVREGDVLRLRVTENASGTSSFVSLRVDVDETAVRREEVEDLRSMLSKAPEGDLELWCA